ncbi:MAG TPA: methylmalonyl-CoA mutase family protein [Firmicutes bacterium]|nr:methylmalonyl-CoA mutase family protein [Bacillota bacterium]
MESQDVLRKERERWEAEAVARVTRKHPEQKKEFTTISGVPVERLYTPEHTAGLDYLSHLGFPGEYPFTRGVQPTMYRGRYWTMRQYAGFGSAEETNERFRYLLEQGQMGLSVAFDLPTQVGYDSDHSLAEGEVGRVGVAIDSVEDMETLFAGIPLQKVSTSMTINAPAAVLLAMYQVVGERQGVEPAHLSGTVQNDILKEYAARGTYIFPPAPSLRLVTDVIEYCSRHLPEWNSISISGYHMREAGCTAVQEVAFTLADAIAYVKAAVERGLSVDAFAPRLSFFFGCHIDFLEEVAKFRAARRLWARVMKERFGAKDPRSMMLRFHTQTAGCSLTAQQPENNVVRVTLQALAAVLGGTQSLHTNSMDEALALPSEKAVRVALRTQQIIAYESGVASTIDPLAGSYCVESLTRRIEEEAEHYLQKIEDLGGAVKAIEAGFIQKEIHDAAYRYQMEVEKEERIVVGVNAFQQEEEPPTGLLEVDPRVAERQKEKLERLRSQRDKDAVARALEKVEKVAAGQENLVPAITEAVRAGSTLGEICDAMRRVFGEYRTTAEL